MGPDKGPLVEWQRRRDFHCSYSQAAGALEVTQSSQFSALPTMSGQKLPRRKANLLDQAQLPRNELQRYAILRIDTILQVRHEGNLAAFLGSELEFEQCR
jgi:hypothetical protein